MKCDNFYAVGEFATDLVEVGACFPNAKSQAYPVGTWKYWNQDGQLVAEGPYIARREYTYISTSDYWRPIPDSKIDLPKWKLWNAEGDPAMPNEDMITQIKDCTEILALNHKLSLTTFGEPKREMNVSE